jgi:hypothetical protein
MKMDTTDKKQGEYFVENINLIIKKHIKAVWLISVSLITIAMVITYFILHSNNQGEEQVLLNKDQLSVITSLITQNQDSVKTDDTAKKILIEDYLSKNLPVSDSLVVKLLKTYSLNQLIIVLPTYPFRIKSYFWLSGNWVLMEVVFWSLFGLIASLMFTVTTIRGFKEELISEHVGKFFYTPFICIIIYLALNALVNNGSISLAGVGKSVIVLSFVLGFFTRRAILLLVRIKDLILPKTQEVIDSDNELRNKYPNEIKGTVTNNSITKDQFEKLKRNVKVTIERKGREDDKDSYFLITENLNPEGKFYFNSLLAGVYNVECCMEVDSDKYEKKITVPLSDTDVPVELEMNLEKV